MKEKSSEKQEAPPKLFQCESVPISEICVKKNPSFQSVQIRVNPWFLFPYFRLEASLSAEVST